MLQLRRRWFLAFVPAALLACATDAPKVRSAAAPEPLERRELAAAPAVEPARELRFVVLHTNDVHGQALTRKATWLDKSNPPLIGGLPRVAGYVNAAREEAKRDGEELLVVDAGDWYQGTPEGLVDGGMLFVQALALVGYDAMCVGNHEFDRGLAHVLELLKQSGVPAVCANLNPRGSEKRVDWVPPYRIVERGGVRIALVGLLTPVTPEITHPDARTLDFVDPVEAFKSVASELRGKADWILPLTHLGVDDDRRLARAFPELPLIVGGHSHTYLKEGVREGSTLIVQSGSKASAIGRVELTLHVDTGTRGARKVRVNESKARLVDLLEEPADAFRSREIEASCAKLEERTSAEMEKVVGELDGAARRTKGPLESGSAGNLIADVLRERARADVGLMNRGGIRTDIEAGPVTRREVFEVMPFDNTLVTLELSGAQLEGLVRNAVEGTAHSGLEASGLAIVVSVDADKKRRLEALRVNGAPVDEKRAYSVAMNSFMADGGDAYIAKGLAVKRQDTGLLIRDVLEDAFVAKGKLTPPTENRYEVHGP